MEGKVKIIDLVNKIYQIEDSWQESGQNTDLWLLYEESTATENTQNLGNCQKSLGFKMSYFLSLNFHNLGPNAINTGIF